MTVARDVDKELAWLASIGVDLDKDSEAAFRAAVEASPALPDSAPVGKASAPPASRRGSVAKKSGAGGATPKRAPKKPASGGS